MAEETIMEVKRVREESESPEVESDSPEVKRLRENLLDDGLDDDPDFCGSNQDLDSFIKRFEEEIAAGGGEAVVGVTSESGESRPELGYLLEASDDELGIPPPTTSSAVEFANSLVRLESDPSVFGCEFWGVPAFDAFGPGSVVPDNFNRGSVDGLVDYSDPRTGSGEYPRRPETLPAQ